MRCTILKKVTIWVEGSKDADTIWQKLKELMKDGKLLPLSMEKKIIGSCFEPIEINLQVKEEAFEDLLMVLQKLELSAEFDVVI